MTDTRPCNKPTKALPGRVLHVRMNTLNFHMEGSWSDKSGQTCFKAQTAGGVTVSSETESLCLICLGTCYLENRKGNQILFT